MEISSHYYAVLAMCLTKGMTFKMARTVAYASQFVDDAKINHIYFNTLYDDEIFTTSDKGLSELHNISTCHSYFKVKTFNYQSMILNTALFHFFPGNTGETFTKKMRCKESPSILVDLINETIAEDTFMPEKFGMLLHIYADTFAHQGFSGILSLENDIENLQSDVSTSYLGRIKKLILILVSKRMRLDWNIDKVLPAYGHAQAFHIPDVPWAQWSYEYDTSSEYINRNNISKRNNIEIYRKAFQSIADFIDRIHDQKVFLMIRPNDSIPEQFFQILAARISNRKKIGLWKEFIYKICPSQIDQVDYDENLWLCEVFDIQNPKILNERILTNMQFKKEFTNSSWFKFTKSVYWFKQTAINWLAEQGLTIPI